MNRLLFFLLLLPLLQSCSISYYVYNRLNWIVHWYVDDYVRLTPAQERTFNQSFGQLQEWHRKTELKRYQHEFENLKRQLQETGLTRAEIGSNVIFYRDKSLGFWSSLVKEAEPHLLALAQNLSTGQKQQLTQNIERKVRQRYARKQAMTASEWQDEKIRRIEKSLSPWVGSFTREQDKKIRHWAAHLNNLDDKNLKLRLRIVAEVKVILEQPEKKTDGRLARLISDPDLLKTKEHLKLMNENRQITEQLIVDIIAMSTTSQKEQMLEETGRWIKRIRQARQG